MIDTINKPFDKAKYWANRKNGLRGQGAVSDQAAEYAGGSRLVGTLSAAANSVELAIYRINEITDRIEL